MTQTVFAEAINQAHIEEMRRDENVFIMGADIRRAVYSATANLLSEFRYSPFRKWFFWGCYRSFISWI